jgi:hypothetical protein
MRGGRHQDAVSNVQSPRLSFACSYKDCCSLISRLHQAEKGTRVAYAKWPDRLPYEVSESIAGMVVRSYNSESP